MVRLLIHRLRHDRALKILLGWAALIAGASLITAWTAWSIVLSRAEGIEKAVLLSDQGRYAEADEIYLEVIADDRADTEAILSFITNRAHAGAEVAGYTASATRQIWADSPASVAAIANYWLAVQFAQQDPDPEPVERLARRRPPVRYANSILGDTALLAQEPELASVYYEQEGLAHPEAVDDLRAAIDLRRFLEDHEWIRRRLDDPRYTEAFTLSDSVWIAVHDRNWPRVLGLIIPSQFAGVRTLPLLLALIAGVLWFWVASRMGLVQAGVAGRLRLYVFAAIAGVFSVYPTLLLVILQDYVLGFTDTGNPIADAIYYVFGVGLREEAMKFLAFLALTPLLKGRSRLEYLMAGAFVGLGFAAEENVNYFHQYSLEVAITRFLTANFLHMALTGLIALAWHDRKRARPDSIAHFNLAFPLAVLLHGAYDLFLSLPSLPEGWIIAMGIFVVMSFYFLEQLMSVIGYEDRRPILHSFVLSILILTGFTYVYAATLVGPLAAMVTVAHGLLGVVFLILVFFRQLSSF